MYDIIQIKHISDLPNSETNFRCKMYDGSTDSTISLFPARQIYNYFTEYNITYSNTKFFYRDSADIKAEIELVETSYVSRR